MSELRLEYPVYTLDNKLLLPAGTVLSRENIEILADSSGTKAQKSALLEYSSIKEDIAEFFEQNNYRIIFQDQNTRKTILEILNEVRLPRPILESIYYFKEHDFYTYRHILMVSALSTLLAKDLLRDDNILMDEVISAPTHDIGKISVPVNILKKKTPLRTAEQKILQHHTLSGYVLLCYYFRDAENLPAIIARDHHEKRDGTGYPSGMRVNDLMIEIVMVSDIFDALISTRSYRPTSYNIRTALEEITEMSKIGKINWDIVKALISHNRRDKSQVSECVISAEKRGVAPADNQYGVILNNDDNNIS